jgi:ankyrin repeat protein
MGNTIRFVAGAVLGLVVVMSRPATAITLSLPDAVERRDAAAVRALLQQHIDVNAPQGDGTTALHWAARWDDLETAGLLLRAGADVDSKTDLGVTPLWLACQNGSARTVQALVAGGADVSAALVSGETMLMRAAWTGNVDVVKLLLKGGAAVNAKENGRGQTALMWAVSQRNSEVARILVEHGADIHARSTTGFTPLLFAARVGDVESARLLLDAGAAVNDVMPPSKNDRPRAASRRDVDGTCRYLGPYRGYDPVCTPIAGSGGSALLIAAVRGHTKLVKHLLERGADANNDGGMGYTALHWASGAWGTELVGQNGIAQGVVDEWDALAGLQGPARIEMVEVLLAHGANPNARLVKVPPRTGRTKERQFGINRDGATPFLLAAQAGDARVMRLLADAGADARLGTNEQTTPLMAAASIGRVLDENPVPENEVLEAVKLALQLGNDVNAANILGETALHAAAANRLNSVVQFLVDHDARVNARNSQKQTALSLAELTRQFAGIEVVEGPTSTGNLLRKLGGTK